MGEFITYRQMAAIQTEGDREMNRYSISCQKKAMIHQSKTGESALDWLKRNGVLKTEVKPPSHDGNDRPGQLPPQDGLR